MAIENISVDIKANLEKIKKDLTDIDNRIKQLKNERPKLQLDSNNLQKTKASISAIDVAIKKLQAQKAEVKVSSESADIVKKKMQEITHAMDILRSRKASLNIDAQMLKGADTRLTKLDREMQTLNTRKANLQVSADQLMGASKETSSLAGKLDKLSSKIYQINVKDNLSNLGNKATNAGNKIMSAFNPLTSKINQALGLGLAVKTVDSAVGMITGSVDSAIKRMDTLNNYTKVMGNLGVTKGDAKASKRELVKGLQGLPTALDDGVAAVQRFTSKNEDVKKSTKIFLGLNNAILAGGADSQIQASALEQISQSYSKGKPDMIEWRSLLTAMPAQVKMIASTFNMTSDQLGDALRNGSISMDDFMGRIAELNDKGGKGFRSFSDQAKDAVGGVGTGLANMHTAVTRGVAGVMGSIDKALKAGGQGGIATVLGKVGDAFEKNLNKIGSLIETHQKDISTFFTSIITTVSKFDFIAFFRGIGSGLQSMGRDAKAVMNFASPLLKLLGNGNVVNGIGKLIPRLFELGIAFKAVGIGLKVASGVSGVFGKFSKLKFLSFGKKGGGLGVSPKEIGTNLLGDLGGIAKNAGNLALIFGAIKVLEEGARALKQVDENVPNNYGNLAIKIGAIAGAVTAIGSLAFIASKIPKEQLITGLGAVVVVSAEIAVASLALKTMNENVSSDLNGLAGKMIAIIGAVGAMSLLTAVLGEIVSKNPATAVVGLMSVGVIALEIVVLSKSLHLLDKNIKGSWGSLGKKLGMLATTVGAMLVITEVVGGTALATAPVAIAGFVGIIALAKELTVVSKSIGALDKNVPANIGSVKKKLTTLKKVIATIADLNTGGFWAGIKNQFKSFSLGGIAKQMKALGKIAKSATTLSKLKMDHRLVKKNIDNLIEIAQSVSTGFKDIHVKESKGNAKIAQSIDKILSSMANIVKKANDASGNINPEPILVNVRVIRQIVGEVFKTFASLATDDSGKGLININKRLDNLDTTLFRMSTIIKRAVGASGNINPEPLLANMSVIQTVFQKMKEILGGMTEDNGKENININRRLDNLDTTLFRMGTIIKRAVGASGNINAPAIEANVQVIKTLYNQMLSFPKEGLKGTLERLNDVDTAIYRLGRVLSKMREVATNIPFEAVNNNINGAIDVINRLNAFPTAKGVNSIYELVSAFGRLLGTLSGLNGKFNGVGQDYGKQIVQGFKSVNVPNAFVAIINSAITQLQTKVVNFKNIGQAYGQALKNAFVSTTQEMGNSIDSTIGKMSAKNASFANLGNLFGNSLTTSFGNSLMTLSKHVGNTVQAMQLSFDSLKAPSIDLDVRQHVRRSGGVLTASTGGSVNNLVRKQRVSYLSDGGSIFQPKGTDVHPAMLASGEYVQKASATNYFGSKFMDRVNASDLKGTLQALSSRFSSNQLAISSGNNAVYNYHNVRDNHSRYNQTVITNSPDFAMKNPNRFLR